MSPVYGTTSRGRLERLLAQMGLPVGTGGIGLDEAEVLRRVGSDKKAIAGKVYFVLPRKLGRADRHPEPVPEALVREVVRGL